MKFIIRTFLHYNQADSIFTTLRKLPGGLNLMYLMYADEEQIVRGTHQPIVSSEPGSDLQTISQNLTLALAADHAGKMLICRAEHDALDVPRDVKRQLVVHCE
jgi:hypothetical protein